MIYFGDQMNNIKDFCMCVFSFEILDELFISLV
jgi:hypothetical protein